MAPTVEPDPDLRFAESDAGERFRTDASKLLDEAEGIRREITALATTQRGVGLDRVLDKLSARQQQADAAGMRALAAAQLHKDLAAAAKTYRASTVTIHAIELADAARREARRQMQAAADGPAWPAAYNASGAAEDAYKLLVQQRHRAIEQYGRDEAGALERFRAALRRIGGGMHLAGSHDTLPAGPAPTPAPKSAPAPAPTPAPAGPAAASTAPGAVKRLSGAATAPATTAPAPPAPAGGVTAPGLGASTTAQAQAAIAALIAGEQQRAAAAVPLPVAQLPQQAPTLTQAPQATGVGTSSPARRRRDTDDGVIDSPTLSAMLGGVPAAALGAAVAAPAIHPGLAAVTGAAPAPALNPVGGGGGGIGGAGGVPPSGGPTGTSVSGLETAANVTGRPPGGIATALSGGLVGVASASGTPAAAAAGAGMGGLPGMMPMGGGVGGAGGGVAGGKRSTDSGVTQWTADQAEIQGARTRAEAVPGGTIAQRRDGA